MNTLLPKSETEFSEVNYWERFFKSRSKSFDWYGEYISLIDLFTKYVKKQDDILVVGCGNSTLSYDLYATQKCSKVCSIDISNNAIRQMLKKHSKFISKIIDKKNKAFDFKCLDVCSFSHDTDIQKLLPVSCVIDKGTTDAIHSGGISSEMIINNMWKEIEKNLALMGRYILITLAQSHIVESITNYFLKPNENHWMINVHEISKSNFEDKGFSLPVFAFVFYKMNPSPSLPLVYIEENSFSKTNSQIKEDKKILKNPIAKLKEWIVSRQHLSILSHSMQESKDTESVINMISSSSGLVRYHCVLVRNSFPVTKRKVPNQLIYCVFIVPFAFNDSDIVRDKEARLKLCREHLKSRVCLFVYLNPREHYTSRDCIQQELNSIAIKFCPDDVSSDFLIPFVSCHEFVYKSTISACDDWFFESLETPNGEYERLVSPNSKVSVVVASKPLTVRDRLLSKYVKLMPDFISGKQGVYYGQTSCCESLDKRWKLIVPNIDQNLSSILREKMHVDCFSSSEECYDVVNWVVYDSDHPDVDNLKILLGFLSEPGIAVLCGVDSIKVKSIISDLPLSVMSSYETVETFGGDKTNFFILYKGSNDISLLTKSFNDLCC